MWPEAQCDEFAPKAIEQCRHDHVLRQGARMAPLAATVCDDEAQVDQRKALAGCPCSGHGARDGEISVLVAMDLVMSTS